MLSFELEGIGKGAEDAILGPLLGIQDGGDMRIHPSPSACSQNLRNGAASSQCGYVRVNQPSRLACGSRRTRRARFVALVLSDLFPGN